MGLKVARFLAFLFVALALGAGLAHLYALPNKIDLPKDAYLAAQQAYRGWAVLGVVVLGEIVTLAVLAYLVRGRRLAFGLTFGALLCALGSQALFWAYTYPANQATGNWTELPADWVRLRAEWEYSHAAGALLTLAAFVLLVLSVLVDEGRGHSGPGNGSRHGGRKRRGRLEFMSVQ
jgi:nitric oxide reductase large subunit